jgi:SAM-dependent methyltransferase
MRYVDRFLQKERIKRVEPYVKNNFKILDIGCNHGELFQYFLQKGIAVSGVGIDPNIEDVQTKNYKLIKDVFPSVRLEEGDFDVIALLAVLEHIPMDIIPQFTAEAFKRLKGGGKIVITVPSPSVDAILEVLLFFKLIKGMELGQHYGYDINKTEALFEQAGFKLVVHKTFQLGINNLFVFEKL